MVDTVKEWRKLEIKDGSYVLWNALGVACDRIDALEAQLGAANEAVDLLDSLIACGVDNWDGWNAAQEMLQDE